MRTRNSKVYSEFGRTEAPKIGPRPHWLPKSKQTPDREDLPIPPEPTPNRLVELEGVIEFHSAMGGLLKPNGQPITKNDIYAYFETLSRTDTGSVATRNAVEGPLQPEEEEKDEEDFNDFDAEIFNPEKVELIAAKASTMKRKEFSLNPVCCNCKQQYNEDDNPDGCCTYHRGSLEPESVHDHWADAFSGMDDSYDSEEDWDPDAWSWSCCGGNAKAEPCYEGPHRKQSNKRNRRQ